MGIIVPLKFQTFCPIISHLIVPWAPSLPTISVPSLACRFPPQIDLAIGRLAFPQWRGRGKEGIGGKREGEEAASSSQETS